MSVVQPLSPPRRLCRPDGSPPAARTRPALGPELIVVLALVLVYDKVADLARLRPTAAYLHAYAVLGLERALGVGLEHPANRWLVAQQWLHLPATAYYTFAHTAVTLAVLAAVYVRAPAHYRALRSTLVATNVLALAVFWLWPVAPPRLLPAGGFIDIGAATPLWGGLSGGGEVARHANQFAAVPSLHAAWAGWTVLAVFLLTRHVVLRAIALLHLALTVGVILATANHYLLDVVAGGLTLVVAGLACQALPVASQAAVRLTRAPRPVPTPR